MRLVHVLLTLLVAAASAITISPTNDLCNELNSTIAAIVHGDPITIYLEAGDYSGCTETATQSVTLQTPQNATVSIVGAGSGLTTIRVGLDAVFAGDRAGEGPGNYTLKGFTIYSNFVWSQDNTNNFVIIDDLHVLGVFSTGPVTPVYVSRTSGSPFEVVVRNCVFEDIFNGLSVVRVTATMSTVYIEDSQIRNCSAAGAFPAAVYIQGSLHMFRTIIHDACNAFSNAGSLFVFNSQGVALDAVSISCPHHATPVPVIKFASATSVILSNVNLAHVELSSSLVSAMGFVNVPCITLSAVRVTNVVGGLSFLTTVNANAFEMTASSFMNSTTYNVMTIGTPGAFTTANFSNTVFRDLVTTAANNDVDVQAGITTIRNISIVDVVSGSSNAFWNMDGSTEFHVDAVTVANSTFLGAVFQRLASRRRAEVGTRSSSSSVFGSFTFDNCEFRSCTTGITIDFQHAAVLVVRGCRFEDARIDRGLYTTSTGSDTYVIDCIFHNVTATGGLVGTEGRQRVTDCVFSNIVSPTASLLTSVPDSVHALNVTSTAATALGGFWIGDDAFVTNSSFSRCDFASAAVYTDVDLLVDGLEVTHCSGQAINAVSGAVRISGRVALSRINYAGFVVAAEGVFVEAPLLVEHVTSAFSLSDSCEFGPILGVQYAAIFRNVSETTILAASSHTYYGVLFTEMPITKFYPEISGGSVSLTNVLTDGEIYRCVASATTVVATNVIVQRARTSLFDTASLVGDRLLVSGPFVGLLDSPSLVTITNSVFASSSDTVIDCGGSCTVYNVTVSDSDASYGTAVAAVGSGLLAGAVTMTDTTIIDCTSDDGVVTFAGTSSGNLTRVVAWGNYASNSGGAVLLVEFAELNIVDCRFDQNSAQFSGGTITANGASLSLTSTVISRSESPVGGAVTASLGCEVTLNNSVIRDNTATTSGGGLDCRGDSTCTLSAGTRVANNTAPSGGGLFAQFTTVSLSGSTVADNTATVAGSAMCCFTSAVCSAEGVAFRDNVGAAGLEVLIGGELALGSCIVDGHGVGLSAFAAASLSVTDSAFTRGTGRALDCSGTPTDLRRVVVRDNSGSEAIFVSGVESGDVSLDSMFIAGNAGVGVGCDTAVFNLTNSIVCDNAGGPVDCDDSCGIVGDGGSDGCVANATECATACVAADYCVPATGFYAGPYDGCFECGGACDLGSFTCTANAVCIDVAPADGPYSCVCATGYTGDGFTSCTDIDECVSDPCSPDAICANTAGSFTCTCKSGYSGDGYDCVDNDECAATTHTCSANATCINIPGGFNCGCDTDFYGSGGDCVACPAHSGATAGTAFNASDCDCDPTYYRMVGDDGPCELCPAGYRRFLVPDACVQCGKGSYSANPNSLSCTACPADMTTPTGSVATSMDDCKCGVGYVKSGDGLSCVSACVPGTYINPDGGCADCPPASYTNATNALACTSCPPYTQTTAAIGNVDVRNCSCLDQFYRSIPGDPTSGCLRFCPAGSSRPADDSCAVCGIGTYADAPNLESCIKCPANAVSKSNSTAVTDCRCPSGYFSEDRKYGTECKVCPQGARCRGGRSPPEALPNYYPVDGGNGFAECTPAAACAGGGECAAGYTGNLCAACDAGYYRLDGLCRTCSNAPGLILTLFFLLLLGFCAALTWFNTKERALNQFVSLAIGVNSLQVIAMYGRLELAWPPLAQKFFDALSIFNFNIELFAPECASPGVSAFWLRWTLTMFIPVMAGAMFGLILAVSVALIKAGVVPAWSSLTPTYMSWTVLRAFFQLMSFVYLPLAAAVFEYFDCVVDGSGVAVIAGARDTVCYDSTYWSFAVVAFFGLLAYPIGIPTAAGLLLRRGHASNNVVRFALKYGFLVARYREEYYFYELAVMARKLSVALVFSFVFNNVYIKAGCGVAVLLFFYAAQVGSQPYRHRLYNEMEMVCLACAMLVLLFTVTFQAVDVVPGARDAGIVTVLLLNVISIAVGVLLDVRRQVLDDEEANSIGGRSGVFASSSVGSGATDDDFKQVAGVQMDFVVGNSVVIEDDDNTVGDTLSTWEPSPVYDEDARDTPLVSTAVASMELDTVSTMGGGEGGIESAGGGDSTWANTEMGTMQSDACATMLPSVRGPEMGDVSGAQKSLPPPLAAQRDLPPPPPSV